VSFFSISFTSIQYVRHVATGSGCTKGLGKVMSRLGPHGPFPQSQPARGDFFCKKNVNCLIFTLSGAISPRSLRPNLPTLTPETYFCGVRGGSCMRCSSIFGIDDVSLASTVEAVVMTLPIYSLPTYLEMNLRIQSMLQAPPGHVPEVAITTL
jgi:hypothetical protein